MEFFTVWLKGFKSFDLGPFFIGFGQLELFNLDN